MSFNLILNKIDISLIEQIQGIFLAESGHKHVNPGFQSSLSTDCGTRLLYISSGTCLINIGKDEYFLRKNDAFFLFPGVTYKLNCLGKDSTEFWWLDLFGPNLNKIFRQLAISPNSSNSPFIRGIANPNFLQEIRSIVLRYSELLYHDMFSIMGSLYKLLAILLEECAVTAWTSIPYDDPNILYTGKWTPWPSPSCRNHEEFYTATPRSFAELNFYGSGIRWFGTMNFDCGRADVIIDGIYQTTVDTYNPTRLVKQLLYANTHLSNGHHIIKVFCTGEKNDKATNCDIVVESFQYFTKTEEQEPLLLQYSSGIVKKAAEIIKSGYTNDISLDTLAERLGVSRAYLSTRFKIELGISPAKYLTSLRMAHAKNLLRNTSMTIGEIANTVGYQDGFYFSRIFKKEQNITPTQYRDLNKRKTNDGSILQTY